MKEVIPFEQWLEQYLLPESRETNTRSILRIIEHYLHINPIYVSYPIIKRRIAWVIGKWVSDSCSPATNPKIWEVLVQLLTSQGPGTDAVVRLTAAVAIKECVDVGRINALQEYLVDCNRTRPLIFH
jgi:hypothetical protein